VLEQLWAPIVAVTAAHDGCENGLISSTVVTASLLPESPRIVVQLSKTNLTRDLVCASGAFAVHFLPDDDRRALDVVRCSNARFDVGDRIPEDRRTGPTRRGGDVVELRRLAAGSDSELPKSSSPRSSSGDVVGGTRVRDGAVLTIHAVRGRLPPEWAEEWKRRLEAELAAARRHR
jgi:hypothetical protein